MNLVKDLKDHELKINKEEIKILDKINKKLNEISEELENLKKTIKQLEIINLYEIFRGDMPKEDELEILKSVFDKHAEITRKINELVKLLIDLKIKIKEEVI